MGFKILITGGAGFIGSNFVRLMLAKKDAESIVILDNLTYAGSLDNLEGAIDDPRVEFIRGDIANSEIALKAMRDCDYVINFAAESHVDRSINDASPFMRSNIDGVRVLLEAARIAKPKRFLQISTDEVYGSVEHGETDEHAPLLPSSPYSASKASADLFAHAFATTFNVPILIARSANNYGEYQYPEKLIPRFVSLALHDKPLPVYGNGENLRDWLYVRDNCRALFAILANGEIGQTYNIGASQLHKNIDIAHLILQILGKPSDMLNFVPDRLGHDRRYCVDWSKIAALGWAPEAAFEAQFEKTVLWFASRINMLERKTAEAESFYTEKNF